MSQELILVRLFSIEVQIEKDGWGDFGRRLELSSDGTTLVVDRFNDYNKKIKQPAGFIYPMLQGVDNLKQKQGKLIIQLINFQNEN